MKTEEIIEKIKDLEAQLSQLRIELENERPKAESTERKKKSQKKASLPIKIGEEVLVLNPKKGQGKEGIVTKVNVLTGYGTVETVNERNKVEKVVRKLKNLRKK